MGAVFQSPQAGLSPPSCSANCTGEQSKSTSTVALPLRRMNKEMLVVALAVMPTVIGPPVHEAVLLGPTVLHPELKAAAVKVSLPAGRSLSSRLVGCAAMTSRLNVTVRTPATDTWMQRTLSGTWSICSCAWPTGPSAVPQPDARTKRQGSAKIVSRFIEASPLGAGTCARRVPAPMARSPRRCGGNDGGQRRSSRQAV